MPLVSMTTSKKRKFNEISHSKTATIQQFESLNLSKKLDSSCGIGSKGHLSVTAQYEKSDVESCLEEFSVKQQSKRRKMNDMTNYQPSSVEDLQAFIAKKKIDSKDKKPFQTLFTQNNSANLLRFNTNLSDSGSEKSFYHPESEKCKGNSFRLNAAKPSSQNIQKSSTIGGIQNENYQKVIRKFSPRRLSHISE